MPFDTTQLLSLVNMSPRAGVDTNISTLPQFVLQFNIPVNANLVNTAQGLNQYVVLVQLGVQPVVPVQVTSGTVDTLGRTLSFYPTQALVAGATYQITIRRGLQTAQGRGMENDRTWTFAPTLVSSAVGAVTLLTPGDATAYTVPPTLYWDALTSPSGILNYELQLDDDFLFGPPPLYSTVLSVSGGIVLSSNIGVSLNDRTEYFWRVRAYTTSATGDWSGTRSFFLGDAVQASPDTAQLYDPSPFFRLTDFTPDNGATNLTAHPSIVATFSQAVLVSSVTTDTVQLFYGPVDGRTDIPTVQDTSASYTIVGNQILIGPSVTLQTNQRYTIVLNDGISSASGTVLNELFTSYYTSYYKPLYGGVIGVRSRLGGFVNTVSDDEILFFLWRASLHVNELLATRVFRVRDRISFDELVNYDPPFKTYGQYQYSEIYAAVHILESFYFDLLNDAGKRVALSVFEYEVQVTILNEIRQRIKDMRQEMHVFGARFLRELVLPRVGMKSQFHNPVREQNPLARDWSFHPRRRF
jgi:hypothetical protein